MIIKVPTLVTYLFVSVGMIGQPLTKQQGNASYYADRFHGRTMSNGEIYHRDSMTCAHLRYPLGTWLHVRNLVNGKEVVVRVTDRGPYSGKFVIDLSRAAAQKLGIIYYGFQPVEITPLVAARVPYLYPDSPEKPEMDLGFSEDADWLQPYWEDSLSLSISQDTALLKRVQQTDRKVPPASSNKNKKRR